MTAGELWRDATESETVLWWMPVHSPPREAMARWLAILDKTEQARAERFRFAEDREIYVAAHALMRTLLSRFCPLPPSAWRFIAAPTGKPEIHPDMGVARIRVQPVPYTRSGRLRRGAGRRYRGRCRGLRAHRERARTRWALLRAGGNGTGAQPSSRAALKRVPSYLDFEGGLYQGDRPGACLSSRRFLVQPRSHRDTLRRRSSC